MRVVVVGGGFAGVAAAIALQERRLDVLLLERRGVLGGRATSSRDALSGEPVGSGAHVLLGAHRETLDLLRRVGTGERLLMQESPRIDFADAAGSTVLRCPPWMAPFHLGTALLGLRLPWRTRGEAMRLGLALRRRLPPPEWTLSDYLAHHGQGPESRRLLWEPLVAAFTGDVPERTSARPLVGLLRELIWSDRRAAGLVLARGGLGELHEMAARYLVARGGTIRRRALVQAVDLVDGSAAAVRYVQRAETRAEIRAGKKATDERVSADAVILAVPWSAIGSLVPDELRSGAPFAGLARLAGVPAVTIEMWIDRVAVENPATLVRDGGAVWVVDRGRLLGRAGPPQHLAVRLAPGLSKETHTHAEWTDLGRAALRRVFPAMREARVERAVVLKEPEAFFASDPESERQRPGARTPVPNLFLAGDWTNTGLPSSIESAVRSGREAARALEAAR